MPEYISRLSMVRKIPKERHRNGQHQWSCFAILTGDVTNVNKTDLRVGAAPPTKRLCCAIVKNLSENMLNVTFFSCVLFIQTITCFPSHILTCLAQFAVHFLFYLDPISVYILVIISLQYLFHLFVCFSQPCLSLTPGNVNIHHSHFPLDRHLLYLQLCSDLTPFLHHILSHIYFLSSSQFPLPLILWLRTVYTVIILISLHTSLLFVTTFSPHLPFIITCHMFLPFGHLSVSLPFLL